MIENPNVICNDCAYCKQNKELRELLKECRPFVELCNYTPENKKLLDSINTALGEDE